MVISPAELRLLQHLHERSGVSGGRIGLDPKPITRELRINATQLAQDSAALVAHGFVGVRNTRSGDDCPPSTTCSAIWVTSKGQEYLKRTRSRSAATPTS